MFNDVEHKVIRLLYPAVITISGAICLDAKGNDITSTVDMIKVAAAIQKDVIRDACAGSIIAGCVSSALGAAYTYPTALTDQHNMDAQVLAANIFGAAKAPYNFWGMDANGAWAHMPHTAAQIIQAGSDVRQHVVDRLNQSATLQGQIDAAAAIAGATQAQIEAIVWIEPTTP